MTTTTRVAEPTAEPRPDAPRARVPRRRMSGVLAASVLGSAATVAFWWVGATATGVPGATIVSLGELAGLLASFLVCVQVLLIARVPWVEASAGFDRLVSWHRSLGTTVVLLVVTHVLLMVVGGSVLDQVTVWAEVPGILRTQPYLWWALFGTAAFLLVGLSSSRLARARLSYEWWYAIHLTIYVGIFLAFFHQVAGGTHFVASRPARIAWILLYSATAAAVLVWRVLLPVLDRGRYRLTVTSVVPEARGVVSVWLRGTDLSRMQARGGQHFLVRFVARGHLGTAHPYSLSMVPTDDAMRFTIGALGDHSSGVPAIRPGTRVQVEGPFGRFTADRATTRKVLLVAGGAGIGPVRALAQDLLERGHELVVVHRAHADDGLALAGEFTASPRLRYVPVPGRRVQLGHDPLAPEHLGRLVPDVAERDVFVCGPDPMIATVVRSARTLRVPAAAIHREEVA